MKIHTADLEVVRPGGETASTIAEREEKLIKEGQHVVKTTLMDNFGFTRKTAGEQKKMVSEILTEKGDPSTIFNKAAEKIKGQSTLGAAEETIYQALTEELSATKDYNRAVKIATFLQTCIRKPAHREFPLPANRTQVQQDIQTIVQRLKPPTVIAGKPTIVFTTSVNDAKSMLTIGDAVRTSSCQNYKTGSQIDSLLGYVKDADVQGSLSYVLSSNEFEGKDFDALVKAIDAGKKVVSTYNGNNKTVVFKFSSDENPVAITSKPLGYAHRRHIIKLGEAGKGKSGIVFEPAYRQPHELADEVIEKQVQELKKKIAKAVGGVYDKPISLAGSRNVGGVYSDLAGAKPTGPYKIEKIEK
jgi:hypothetical protein